MFTKAPAAFVRWGLLFTACSTLAACYGDSTGSLATRSGGADDPGGPAGSFDPPTGGVTANGCTPQMTSLFLRRLTNAEYQRTVHELLGVTLDSAVPLPDDINVLGFDNNAEGVHISAAHVEAYQLAAEKAAKDAMASSALRGKVLGCDPLASGCLEGFVDRFGRRAFRRPLTPEQSAELTALAKARTTSTDPYAGARVAVQAMLQSPYFLFRPELGAAVPGYPDIARLTGYELATRLAYLVWGTTPSDALLDAAERGELDTIAGIEQHVRAMLADPRAQVGIAAFAEQWLGLRNLLHATPDAAAYPKFSEALRGAMFEETKRLAEEHLTGTTTNVLGLLTSQHTYVNAALATHYGLPAPPSGQWARVELPATSERRGLLTHASFLTLTAPSPSTMPIHRGKYVREVVMCDAMPPPPADIPEVPAAVPGETERERLERHGADPACSGCHAKMDPIGFGLDRYDGIGQHRTTDASGKAIATDGEVVGLTSGKFNGPQELGALLAGAPQSQRCVAVHLFRYGMGRGERAADECAVQALVQDFPAGTVHFPTLVTQLATSDLYRFRTREVSP